MRKRVVLLESNVRPGRAGSRPAVAGRQQAGWSRVLVGAVMTLIGAGLMAPMAPATAQIGGPIGAPIGVPNGLPAGAAGYPANQGGSLPAPVNNWRAGDGPRGDIGSQFGIGASRPATGNSNWRNPQADLPRPQTATSGSAAPIGATAAPRDPREQALPPRAQEWRDPDEPTRRFENRQSTRQITAAVETNRVDILRDLVQRGQMYETGLGQPRDLNRAFGLYCEAAAAGYPEALVRMGQMFAEGIGVEKNADAAGTLYQRAARFGSTLGADLARRNPARRELLPQCLKGTVVEKGTVERPATAAELAAMAQKLDSGTIIRNPALGAERARIINTVLAEARQYKLDPRLVLAVMATESAFDANAKSPKNAFGLMQLIPETAERFAVKDILDPVENIRGGMAYIRWLLSYFRGDVTLMLAAYNAGEGAVDKYNGVPPFTETLAYVQRIRAIYPHDRHPYDPSTATTVSRQVAPKPTGQTAVAATTEGMVRN